MQAIPGAVIQGQQNANAAGGDSGFGTKQSFKNVVDPGNIHGNSSSSSIFGNLVDPGNVWGMNPNMAAHKDALTTLPNLGANTLIPQRPQGHFMGPDMSGGHFNDMANMSAGRMFNPQDNTQPQMPGSKGAGGKGANPTMPTRMPMVKKGFGRDRGRY